MDNSTLELIGDILSSNTIAVVVAGSIAYFFGLRQYLIQKEREEIREEYINNGIDNIIKALDRSSFICQFNYTKVSEIIGFLKRFTGDINIEKDMTLKIFSEMQPLVAAPEISIYYKLEFLTGENKILSSFLWIVKTIANYLRCNDYFRYELFLELQYYFKYPEKYTENKEVFLNRLNEGIVKNYEKSISENEMIKIHLSNIKKRIEKIGISNRKNLNKIFKDKSMQKILKNLQDDYEKIIKKEDK